MVLMAVLVGVAAFVVYLLLEDETMEVPLGVEHAVTLRYSGPDLRIKPFDAGVAVQLRIAEVRQRGHSLVYDIRYIVSREGEYNIMDYLMSATGRAADNMPSFVVRGIAEQDQTIEKRVEAVEEADVRIWHWYYETLAGLAGLWLLWLVGLIFWHGHHHHKHRPAPPDYDAFYTLLEGFLSRLGAEGLDAAGKLKLEKLMFTWWRDHCACSDTEMYVVLRKLADDPVIGGAYRILEGWLHDSETTISREAVIGALQPYTVKGGTE